MKIVHFLSKIVLATGLSLAMAFTLSCSSDSSSGGGEENNSSSSEGEISLLSSSSIVGDVNSSSSTADLSSSSEIEIGVSSSSETEQSSSSIIGDTSSSSGTEDLSSSSENTTELSSSSIVSEISSSSSENVTEPSSSSIVSDISSSSSIGEVSSSSLSEIEVDGGGLPDNLSKEAQVYLYSGENYTGSVDVVTPFAGEYDYDTGEYSYIDVIPAGKIENGKITLNFPSVDNKYLNPNTLSGLCEGATTPCVNTLKNYKSVSGNIYAVIPEKGLCNLSLEFIEDGTEFNSRDGGSYLFAAFMYVSGAGKFEYTEEKDSGLKRTYDWDFSSGWNVYYRRYLEEINESINSTSLSILEGKTLKWYLDDGHGHCRNID